MENKNGNYYVIYGLYWDNGKMETTTLYRGYVGVILGLLNTA